jgi:predicted ATPase
MMIRPDCSCARTDHAPRRVVLTGGPGAGKTAVLEVVQKEFCRHVVVLPEAASVVFGGGFPRRRTRPAREAAQRAIFRVQLELERIAQEEGDAAVVLCDRGTTDGLAYWERSSDAFWRDVGTTHAEQLARYDAVIHLRTPSASRGYNRANQLRTETPEQAAIIDARLLEVWAPHPDHLVIDSADDFVAKLGAAIAAIARHVPACCLPSSPAERSALGRP